MTQGISTNPATGSQVKPIIFFKLNATACIIWFTVPPNICVKKPALIAHATPHSAWQPATAPASAILYEIIVAMAPAVSLYKIFRGSYIKQNVIVTLLILLVEYCKLGKYSLCNGAKSLKKYNGKIMVVQSKNDNVVSFKSSLGYVKDNIGNKAEYIVMEDRFHNPDYKKEAVDKLMKFYGEMGKCKKEDLPELFKKQNFRAMGELDPEVMDKIVDFLKSNN